jgi:hypothetical protein
MGGDMSTISASTTTTTAFGVTADTTGALVFQTGASPTTALTLSSAQVVTLANSLPEASGGTGTNTGYYGFKNRIINGAMVIDQRNAGASGTATSYTVDRFAYTASQASKGTWQQNAGSVTPPVGFVNYLGFTSSSAYSVASGDYFFFVQNIEGFNVADLGWGTASAKTVTLSFQVYSSLTGTFGGSLLNSAQNRCYPFSYSVSVANTWTTVFVTIAGDTTGTWVTNSGIGIRIAFGLGVGSSLSGSAGSWASAGNYSATGATSVVGTNGATFYITGVQLEKGSTATSFDYRPYGTEFLLCQRYFQKLADGSSVSTCSLATVVSSDTSSIFGLIQFQVPMRTAPSLATTATSFRANMGSVNANSTTALVTDIVSNINIRISQAGYGGALTTDRSGVVRLNGDTGYVAVTAEL